MKKQSKRSKTKNASLKKNYNSKIRQEYMDQDYLGKLDDKIKNCQLPDGTMVTQLEYMSVFMKEWNSGGVGKQEEAEKNVFHTTAEKVKDCTDRTNSRNRDIYGIAKATDRLVSNGRALLPIDQLVDWQTEVTHNTVEEAMVELLDRAKELADTSDDGDE